MEKKVKILTVSCGRGCLELMQNLILNKNDKSEVNDGYGSQLAL